MNSDPSPPTVERAADASALALTLRALRPLLRDRDVMELCINRPNEAFIETRDGWRREPLAFADFEWCSRLAKLVANATQQRIDATAPLVVGIPAQRRARTNRHAAGDNGWLRGDRHPPPGRAGVEHRRSGKPRHFSPHPTCRPACSMKPSRNCFACWQRPSSRRSCASRCAAAKTSWFPGRRDRARPPGPRR